MTWLDAQHQYGAIALRVVELHALHAVVVVDTMAATVDTVTTSRTHPHLTPDQEAVEVPLVAEAGPAEAQNRVGLPPVRPCGTRLKK